MGAGVALVEGRHAQPSPKWKSVRHSRSTGYWSVAQRFPAPPEADLAFRVVRVRSGRRWKDGCRQTSDVRRSQGPVTRQEIAGDCCWLLTASYGISGIRVRSRTVG